MDLLKEFPAGWDDAARERTCPKCGAAPGNVCVAADSTPARGQLCHQERSGPN